MNLRDYVEAARRRQDLDSYNQLSFRLGHTHATRVHNWRKGEDLPREDEIIKLAELAGLDPDRALLDLAAWKAHKTRQPKAAARYAALASRVVAPVALVLALVLSTPSTACAARLAPLGSTGSGPVYIMENLRRVLARLRRRLSWQLAAALASLVLVLVLAPLPAGAADCIPAAGDGRGRFLAGLGADGYEIVAWFRLGTRKQAFVLANAVRDAVVLRVTLPAAAPDGPAAAPPAALPAGEICVIWRGTEYMARQILPPVGAGL